MTNAGFALIMSINAVATAVASVLLGHLSDRVRDRRLLVIFAAVLGGLAYALIYFVPTRFAYILAFCAILPFGGALFSTSTSYTGGFAAAAVTSLTGALMLFSRQRAGSGDG